MPNLTHLWPMIDFLIWFRKWHKLGFFFNSIVIHLYICFKEPTTSYNFFLIANFLLPYTVGEWTSLSNVLLGLEIDNRVGQGQMWQKEIEITYSFRCIQLRAFNFGCIYLIHFPKWKNWLKKPLPFLHALASCMVYQLSNTFVFMVNYVN